MQPESHVSILITDENSSPEEITRLTGLQPTNIWYKGQAIPKTGLLKKANGWQLKSTLPLQSPLADHVNYLLTMVEPFSNQLRIFTGKYFSLLACAIYFDEHAPEVYLDPQVIAKLADLNLGLDIDLYCT